METLRTYSSTAAAIIPETDLKPVLFPSSLLLRNALSAREGIELIPEGHNNGKYRAELYDNLKHTHIFLGKGRSKLSAYVEL